jgi:hypothetical protein
MATEAQCLAADDFFGRRDEDEEDEAERPVTPERS